VPQFADLNGEALDFAVVTLAAPSDLVRVDDTFLMLISLGGVLMRTG